MSDSSTRSDRSQVTLLPECLDDYIAEDNPVRVVDAFVGELDLARLGFDGVDPGGHGPAGVSPGDAAEDLHLRLPQPRSSRAGGWSARAQRNVELMWLTGRLAPDFKTIADFRKDNGAAIRKVCRAVHRAVPAAQAVLRGDRGDRRQQVQGGQQPRQELHRRARCRRAWSRSRQSIARYLAAAGSADRSEPRAAGCRGRRG